jgi:hypothetical protein
MTSGFWKPAPVSVSEGWGGDGERGESIPTAAAFARNQALFSLQQRMLPIFKCKKQIVYAVEEYGVVVIVGETGSGYVLRNTFGFSRNTVVVRSYMIFNVDVDFALNSLTRHSC